MTGEAEYTFTPRGYQFLALHQPDAGTCQIGFDLQVLEINSLNPDQAAAQANAINLSCPSCHGPYDLTNIGIYGIHYPGPYTPETF